MLHRLNWSNGDYAWAKKLCPTTLKYWTKDSQLESVGAVDDRITTFPEKLVQAIGSIQELNEPVVIFSAFGEDGNEWNNNFALGCNLMDNIQQLFTQATDKDGKISYEIKYIEKKVEGFSSDNDLLM